MLLFTREEFVLKMVLWPCIQASLPSSFAKIHQEILIFSYVVLQVIITICFILLLDENSLRTISESASNNEIPGIFFFTLP